MSVFSEIQKAFIQLHTVLEKLTVEEYTNKGKHLSGASIGQQVRHLIEFYIELNKGYKSGTVNYDARKRDFRLETDIRFTLNTLGNLSTSLYHQDKELFLTTDQKIYGHENATIKTTYIRELLYNAEHTVHHMALIRVGVQEISAIKLPPNFGVAFSTIKHQEKLCAQ